MALIELLTDDVEIAFGFIYLNLKKIKQKEAKTNIKTCTSSQNLVDVENSTLTHLI